MRSWASMVTMQCNHLRRISSNIFHKYYQSNISYRKKKYVTNYPNDLPQKTKHSMLFSLNEVMGVNVENVQFDGFFQNIFAKKNNKSV